MWKGEHEVVMEKERLGYQTFDTGNTKLQLFPMEEAKVLARPVVSAQFVFLGGTEVCCIFQHLKG